MDDSNKNEEIFHRVEPHLNRGETLVWAGQSNGRPFWVSPISCIGDVAVVAVLVFICINALLISFRIRFDFDATIYLMLIVFILLYVIVFVFLRFLYIPGRPKRRTICFVTDKRAAHFALRKGKEDEVRSYPLSSLRRLKAKVYPDGSGNVIFKLKPFARTGPILPPLSASWGWPPPSASWGWTESGFFDVEDVEIATHHLSELTGIEPIVRKNLFLGVF